MPASSRPRLFPRSRPLRTRPLLRLVVTVPLLLWLAAGPAAGLPVEAASAPAATGQGLATGSLPDSGSTQPALAAPASQTVLVPGMQTPNGLAVHGTNRRIYVTSRNNDMLYMLDPGSFAVLGQAPVGDLPWGVAVDWNANRVYVANFGSGNVMVFDANTLARIATIDMGAGAQPTFVEILPAAHRVFVANHGSDTVAVIDSDTYAVQKFVRPGDTGAWGLAANPVLNQVYVTFRSSATLVTLDAAFGWEPRPGATFQPCGSPPDAAPYGVAFNQNTRKLFLACAPAGSVNTGVVYYAFADRLMELERNTIGEGGANGGGVATGLGSGSGFFANSASDSVSIVGYPSNQVIGAEPTGDDPFAVAVDVVGRRVIVGNRGGNSLTVFTDPYLPAAYSINGVAVNTLDGKVYVTSRDNNLLLRLKGNGSVELESFTIVGRRPWGIAVNPTTDRVYVANFDDGAVQMLQGSNLANLGSAAVGGEPTFVEVDSGANRVFTVSHAENRLVVLSGATLAVESSQPTGGDGAFGLAVNTKLNRAYVSHRRSGDLVTMDGASGWQPLASQRISACGPGRSPYALAFNPTNDRLYVACATNDNVDTAVVYRAAASGLTQLAVLPLQEGGSDGGGGIAANPFTGNVYFTNSEAGTVSKINSSDQIAGPPASAGLDPFGIAADPMRGYIYVGLRLGNNVVVLTDAPPPPGAGPKITLSRQDGCQGVPLTVYGSGFTPNVSGRVEVRVDSALAVTATLDAVGSFTTSFVLPGPRDPGGERTLTAYDPAQPALRASAILRTPRTDLPVIFMGGIAGSQIVAANEFKYEIPLYNIFGYGEVRTYPKYEDIWLGSRSINEALFFNDFHFYPLRLEPDGLTPTPDKRGRVADLAPGQPIWQLYPPFSDPVDVYLGLYARMFYELGARGRRVYEFGYDWRKNLDETDPLLEQKINQVLAETGKDKVILVGHSMGGMLSRNYVIKHGAGKVDQIITFGTPYLGSVHPAKYLEMGDTMGMEAGPLSLSTGVVKEMARNFGGLYQMLPARLWFERSPFDGASYDPRYLGLAGWMLQEGLLGDIWTAKDVILQSYDETKSYLARNYNASLVSQGDAFTARGIGDLTLMTDQYINQRIIGIGTPTWGHLWACQRPCTVCTKNWWDDGYTCNGKDDVPAIPILDALGDDTVPLRSGAAYEPLAKMRADGHYYTVGDAHHMTLGADVRVQNLVLGLLHGDFCTNQQLAATGNADAAALAPDASAASYAALGTTTGVQLTLLGDAQMTISDAQGRQLSAGSGLMSGYANTIPGANLVAVTGAQVAALTRPGPYTVQIRAAGDLEAAGAARLTLAELQDGAIVRSMNFPGIPITTSTVATATLAGPATSPDLTLTYRYTSASPELQLPGTLLDGSHAGDVAPPAVHMATDAASGLVRITAEDGAGGSGVVQILYGAGGSPQNFVPYSQPVAWPAGARCVTGLALDRAENVGTAQLCRTWLPMLVR